jgi:TRAP-type C4-dicarboxylate transport system substrate-binding protein
MTRYATIIAALLATTGVSVAQAEELRVSTTAPEASPWGAWIAGVSQRVDEMTDGDLKLNVFHGGQLGDEQTTMNLLARGRVDIAAVTTNAIGLIEPGVEAIHLPFAWENDAQFDCAVDNHLMPMIGEMLDGSGAVPVGVVEIPPFVLFSREAIEQPGDLVGLNFRAVPTRVSVGFLNAMGAHAVPLGNTDMVTSLQTGAVDGAVTSGLFGITLGIHQIAPNILLTRHSRVVGTFLVSESVWTGLSESNRAALAEAMSDVDSLRANVRGVEGAMIANVANGGVNVVELDAATRAAWQEAALAAYDGLLAEIGGRAPEVWETMQTAKAACAN